MRRAVLAVLVALMLSACAAPLVQSPLTPPPGFDGPSIEDRAFVVQDGARLPYRLWAPQGEPWAVVVALQEQLEVSHRRWRNLSKNHVEVKQAATSGSSSRTTRRTRSPHSG